jgi:hypothetical protein
VLSERSFQFAAIQVYCLLSPSCGKLALLCYAKFEQKKPKRYFGDKRYFSAIFWRYKLLPN